MENVLYELAFPWESVFDNIVTMVVMLVVGIGSLSMTKKQSSLLVGKTEYDIPYKSSKSIKKVFITILVVVILCILPLTFMLIDIDEYNQLSNRLKSGEYSTVEGAVEQFSPMPKGGHQNESFFIDGVRFEYSDYDGSVGYNNTYYYGGVIRENGQNLQVVYCEGEDSSRVILRIVERETDDDS